CEVLEEAAEYYKSVSKCELLENAAEYYKPFRSRKRLRESADYFNFVSSCEVLEKAVDYYKPVRSCERLGEAMEYNSVEATEHSMTPQITMDCADATKILIKPTGYTLSLVTGPLGLVFIMPHNFRILGVV
ncbi:hypothetical protein KI387_040685, partial [Taxus chinensis]